MLTISTAGGVKLNGRVDVAETPTVCTKGMIHVIGSVLLGSA